MININLPLHISAFLIAFIMTLLISRLIIPVLSQKAKQPIYTEGPAWHISKSGTPTMGGLSFLTAVSLVSILAALFLFFDGEKSAALSLLTCIGYAVMNSAVGIIDDRTKLKRKENAGLTPIEKLIFQFVIAALFLISRRMLIGTESTLVFSFTKVDIGIFYYPLALLVLVGITNCANLTDGIDGLASGVAFAIGIVLFYMSYIFSPEISFISAATVGATTGFLFFNLHPAKIFMGDTGSLFLGSVLGSCAIAMNNPLIIVFLGAVYVIEGISVILQVAFYKMTKKRIFKMAPLHHHLEKCGWSENKICMSAIILTFIISALAYGIFYR